MVEPILEKLGIMSSKELKEKCSRMLSRMHQIVKRRLKHYKSQKVFNNDDFSNTNPVLEATALTFQGCEILAQLLKCEYTFTNISNHD